MSRDELHRANEETRDAWNQNAAFWDERMGEGNDFLEILIWPPTERLLALRPGERVLDVACGNGLTSRRLASAGAEVVALDFADEMIARARARTVEHADRICYLVLDATDEAALRALGETSFDAALCSMALFDMAEIAPLMRALARLLRPGGRFVFSVLHPCFNHARAVHLAELQDREGTIVTTYGVKVLGYKTPSIAHGVAIAGQPRPQLYFDRPLEVLLGTAFEAGFVLDGLEERAFPPDHQPRRHPLGWSGRFSEIPPVLVARLRVCGPIGPAARAIEGTHSTRNAQGGTMDETQAAKETREALGRSDPSDARPLADALRDIWLRGVPLRPPALSPGQQAFLRDWGIADPGFAAVGTPVPLLTAMGKQVARVARSRVADYMGLMRLLWAEYGREGRIVAAVALGPMELAAPDAVIPELREMARSCAFWEDCDQLAMKALEPALRRDPDRWLEPLGDWVRDGNKWVRRAGLTAIGRLPMKKPAYTERCVALAAPALGDPDQDVKRALSFALRVCARGATGPVRDFVLAHREAADVHSLWVLCDVVRSMTRSLLPQFADLLPVYRVWLEGAEPQARRSVEAAVRLLEGAV